MRSNSLKRKLIDGQRSVGTMLFEFATPGIARIAQAAGADFLLIDTEHTGWTSETLRVLLSTIHADGPASVVRVASLEYHAVAVALDLGAGGIMVPNIQSAAEASALVSFARYPPAGIRGAAFGFARDDYAAVRDLRVTMDEADRETLLVAQVESVRGIDNVRAIAAVDGINMVWLGQFDLTVSMGIPGAFENPAYLSAVDALVGACQSAGKVAGMMASTVTEAQAAFRAGFTCVAYSHDVRIYSEGLRSGIAQLLDESDRQRA